MKTLIMATLVTVALTGCASNGWQEYAAKNDCVATGNSKLLQETAMSSMDGGAGGGIGLSPGGNTFSMPRLSIRRAYEYSCSNGGIWSYSEPTNAQQRAPDMVAAQRQ